MPHRILLCKVSFFQDAGFENSLWIKVLSTSNIMWEIIKETQTVTIFSTFLKQMYLSVNGKDLFQNVVGKILT